MALVAKKCDTMRVPCCSPEISDDLIDAFERLISESSLYRNLPLAHAICGI